MKVTYKQRILSYFLVIFVLFAVTIVYFAQSREKEYRTEALESKLNGYAELIHSYIKQNNLNDSSIVDIAKLANVMPDSIRISIINIEGKVLFDKDVKDVSTMQNHSDRPEIQAAYFQNHGTNIRLSASTHHKYIYYAKNYNDYFVRVALPYTINTKSLLQADNYFIYVTLVLFCLLLLLLYFVANRFAKSIGHLKEFTSNIKNNKFLPQDVDFPDDELGEIGSELVEILKQKEKSKKDLEAEKEKFIQHFQFSEEGLGVFDSQLKKIYVNTHFIQYANLITDQSILDIENTLSYDEFKSIHDFVLNPNRDENNLAIQVSKNGKIFLIKVIVFEDRSFEITIRDITKTEKNRILKQEMTCNIAHELRTPVTSLRGYLETLKENNLENEKRTQFTEKAYMQSIRLSELIEDVGLLSKIEESSASFSFSKIDFSDLINTVRIDLSDKIAEKQIKFISSVNDKLILNGNYTLLYSVIHNLLDNSIKYGGYGIEIHIDNYMEDDNYLYFSYYDTGFGVEEKHLNRLFERFYRINEGRTRTTGGSGLGLSIVKNAILLHKGEIQAKKHKDGGLEFLFTLKK